MHGECPIYSRITINGTRCEFAAQRSIEKEKWKLKSGKVIGVTPDIKSLNEHLQAFRNTIFNHYCEMQERKVPMNCDSLRLLVSGKVEVEKTIVPIFQEHNKKIKSRIGMEYALATYKRFEVTLKHIQEFLYYRTKKKDIVVTEIDLKFLTDFEYYLKNIRKCNHNSALKYVKLFKKIVRVAIAEGFITRDPFLNYKQKYQTVERDYLSEEELKAVEEKNFTTPRLDLVRDLFIFSCYTALSYIDMVNLSTDQLEKDSKGRLWIHMFRQKTNVRTQLRLFPKAIEILEKYKDHPVSVSKGKLLPSMSNQKLNAYLKEIAEICKINKHLCWHSARHTFGTTVTLERGVPIETVSSMMSHKNIRTTQIYAKINKNKIESDLDVLELKMKLND
jgi:site-specific recombinase XerD